MMLQSLQLQFPFKFLDLVTEILILIIFVGRLLEAKRPHLYWSPCAAHCLDLMLEDRKDTIN